MPPPRPVNVGGIAPPSPLELRAIKIFKSYTKERRT